ncbi:patatin-like phospholipase family protein [Sphingomonas azotifigens]|uniref:patatin-like phospholipase family protein n=1 Tax=Sphingomonas azotifigens TaxID=330920 RepID=UPI0009FEF9C6|nr:patatin-like phospholipase family protein [Sphingomonas azotifigens]
MRLLRSLVLLAVAGLAVAGCSQPRPKPIAGCNYQMLRLDVGSRLKKPDITESPVDATAADVAQEAISRRLGAQLRERRVRREQERAPLEGVGGAAPSEDQFLALSGGGQHGAFGAGFFYGLAKRGTLPTWDIVTGVSTGSLQSTLLFLANQPVPADRTDYSWVDGPMSGKDGPSPLVVTPGTSNVGDLVLAYSIAREADLMRVRSGGAALGALLKGSTASFAPLQARLRKIMTVGTLQAVGHEWRDRNRQLYVGVSNLDDGEGYAIDMGELAGRTLTTTAPEELARLQGCYIDAMLASSSVPPGVPPLSLEAAGGGDAPGSRQSAMYMDGGARFGMFLAPVVAALKGAGSDGKARVTLLVNTTMDAGPWSGTAQPVQRWSAVTAALRAVDLLETQVYRFSAGSVEQLGMELGGLDMAYLSQAGTGGEAPDDHRFDGKSCAEWLAIDARAKPLQFYPHYMACTVDYGRARGAAANWNYQLP